MGSVEKLRFYLSFFMFTSKFSIFPSSFCVFLIFFLSSFNAFLTFFVKLRPVLNVCYALGSLMRRFFSCIHAQGVRSVPSPPPPLRCSHHPGSGILGYSNVGKFDPLLMKMSFFSQKTESTKSALRWKEPPSSLFPNVPGEMPWRSVFPLAVVFCFCFLLWCACYFVWLIWSDAGMHRYLLVFQLIKLTVYGSM